MEAPESIDDIEKRINGELPLIGTAPKRKDKKAGIWARHPDDYYIEEEWCSQRLFEEVPFVGTIVDPACGSGRIVRAGREYRRSHENSKIAKVLGYDIVRRCRECDEEEDFLTADYETDNIVSNPPFKFCNLAPKDATFEDYAFVKRALANATDKVALLLPLSWITGARKWRFLNQTPLWRVYVLTPRPSMPPGPVIEAGEKPGGGEDDFAWFIWQQGYTAMPTIWELGRDKEVPADG